MRNKPSVVRGEPKPARAAVPVYGAERELKFKNAVLATQQETSLDGILVVDGRQKIISFNRRFSEIWGIPRKVLATRSDDLALSSVMSKLSDPEGFMALVRRLYANKTEKSRDEISLKDGRTLDRYSAGMFGPGGEYYGRVWYFRDITNRKLAEEKINRLNGALMSAVSKLETANRDLESFTYSVSHDLRTPLRHLLTFAGYLEEGAGAALKGEARRHLDAISAAAKRMDLMINSLLDFSRRSRAVPEIREFSGRELAEEVVADLKEDIPPDRKVIWKIGTIPPLMGDRLMLRQALVNLLDNALKYSRGKEPARIEIFSGSENGSTVIGVRDNGAGFDMKLKEELFGVFRRLHPRSEFEGTGIGLANVKAIVLKHGGRVWAESGGGRGTVFYFSLPAAKDRPPEGKTRRHA